MLDRVRQRYFARLWPIWIAGALIGALNAVFTILNGRVMGAWGPLKSLFSWAEDMTLGSGLLVRAGFSPDIAFGVFAIGIVIGSALSTALANGWRYRKTTKEFAFRGFIGGILIAFGASLMQGCTVFWMMGGIPSLSLAAIVATVGIVIGVLVATRQVLR